MEFNLQISRKPEWLRKKINHESNIPVKNLLGSLNLNTICKEAACPNISECFSKKQATFLILGKNCTRLCHFCNVTKAKPENIDKQEPIHIAQAVKKLGLKHVVITSPTRDDLKDGGALQFTKTISEIRKLNPFTHIEVLIPDMKGYQQNLSMITHANPDIIGHNLETVKNLYSIREGANYHLSLQVLKTIKDIAPHIKTKSGIMLGLGETKEQILELFKDLIDVKCYYLSIGQYLAPSKKHYAVKEYIHPNVFNWYKEQALALGFHHVESSPYVRSSYQADLYLKSNNGD